MANHSLDMPVSVFVCMAHCKQTKLPLTTKKKSQKYVRHIDQTGSHTHTQQFPKRNTHLPCIILIHKMHFLPYVNSIFQLKCRLERKRICQRIWMLENVSSWNSSLNSPVNSLHIIHMHSNAYNCVVIHTKIHTHTHTNLSID